MTDTTSDQSHRCRRAGRCVRRVRTADGEYVGVLLEQPGLCRPVPPDPRHRGGRAGSCEERAFAAVRELWTDYQALDQLGDVLPAPRGRDRTRSRATEATLPIRLDVDTCMRDIDAETGRWAARLTGGDPMPTVEHQVVAITTRLGTLIDQPARSVPVLVDRHDGGDDLELVELDGVDAVLRLAALHHRAQSVLGLSESVTMLPDPCPHCGMRALAPSRDQETVSCRGCGISWDRTHFALLNRVLDYDRRTVRGDGDIA